MEKQVCPFLEKCPIFEKIKGGFLDKLLSTNYCQGEFEKCERKKLKNAGKEVPKTLLPNGDVLDHLAN